ncbi:MAG TPA: hypothetical protein VKZ55_08050 [Microthrixaceae bacterium]|nr:hypothetical protein [Microthrixaceae bacterium]
MGDAVELRAGLATAVGPVPFDDAVAASRFVLATQPELPTVPSAGTGPASLLAQAVDGLAGVSVGPGGLLAVDHDVFDSAAIAAAIRSGEVPVGHRCPVLGRFLRMAREHAAGVAGFTGVRAPLLGPVTLALALRGAGVPLEDAALLARELVPRRATALLGGLREVLVDEVAVVCLNEPGLVGAMHPTFPMAPSEVLDLLDPVVRALDQHPDAGRLLIGVHVPGRTDWPTILASGASLVSTPADANVVGWVAELADFLERGGRVAWGAVPVDQPLGTSEERLWRRLSGAWCELVAEGVDPLLLRRASLVSPVDGLGHFGPTQAELALRHVHSLSVRVGRQALAARLSLGA